MAFTIRHMTRADRAPIARIHAESWQSSYRGVLSDAYLDTLAGDDLARQWRETDVSPQDVLMIAEEAGQAVGFIAIWCRPDPYIENLHVRPAVRSGGVGRRLIGTAFSELASRGHETAYLWVFATNEGAIRFYERLGGVQGARETKDVFGNPVPAIRIEWTDLASVSQAAGVNGKS